MHGVSARRTSVVLLDISAEIRTAVRRVQMEILKDTEACPNVGA
jgi:hypothetical protein